MKFFIEEYEEYVYLTLDDPNTGTDLLWDYILDHDLHRVMDFKLSSQNDMLVITLDTLAVLVRLVETWGMLLRLRYDKKLSTA